MFQLPVNNLARIRRARKQVKKSLEDIGLEFCKEAAEEFKEFCPDEELEDLVKDTDSDDGWCPLFSKPQKYRSKPFCCAECSFSSKYYSGYRNHFRNVHRKLLDDQLLLNCPYCSFMANKRTLEMHVKIFHIPSSKQQNITNSQGTVLGTKTGLTNAVQKVEKAMYFCTKCTFRDSFYNVVKRHIYREHFRHVVSPYFGKVSKSSVRNGASVNGNSIFCKQCQFSTRNYEVLVQHVLEYHERIGAQVTSMIAHANVSVPASQPFPGMNQKTQLVSRGVTQSVAKPVIGYLKTATHPVKNKSIIQTSQMSALSPASSIVVKNNQTGVSTSKTQKWKICAVCNELFPENLYSAHFESAHKAKKVWALAKYIVKVHNFTSKCLVCNRYLPSNTLLNHMLIHGLTCPQCHSIFHSVEKIMGHQAQSHPGEFIGPADGTPLTFDLTIKQGTTRNIQLVVLTFNMNDSVNGQDLSVLPIQNVPPPGRVPSAKMAKYSDSQDLASMFQNTDVRKTVCPLCLTVIKAPIKDALALHLREQHQVLQTMHPVEKRMTYKCIHCLGVYTSNMVASTITLHLVQCRAIGRTQVAHGFKSAMALNSSGAGAPKRRLPMQGAPTAKKTKRCEISCENNGLALDAKGYGNKTYLAKKEFLTSYFNLRPYPTPDEELKLSTSLNMWRSEVASHFASKRNICFRNCRMDKPSVKLGFNMRAVRKVKHHLIFENGRIIGTSAVRSAGRRSTPHSRPRPGNLPKHALKRNTCTETISIDSDSEEERKKPPTENKDEENQTAVTNLVDADNPSAEKCSLEDGNENVCVIVESDTPPAEDVELKDQTDPAKETNHEEPSAEMSSLQDGSDDACVVFESVIPHEENVESEDQENLPKDEEADDFSTESPFQDGKENVCMTFETGEACSENMKSKDGENPTEEAKDENSDHPSTEESSLQDGKEYVNMMFETETSPENMETKDQENLADETQHEDIDDLSTEESSFQDGKEYVNMTFETKTSPENMETKYQENLAEEPKLEDIDDPSTEESSFQDGKEYVTMTFETETSPENMESKDQENLAEEPKLEDVDDPSTEESSFQDGKEYVNMTFETETSPENMADETQHEDIDDPLTEKSVSQDGEENVFMTFETEMSPSEDVESILQENFKPETNHEDTDDSSTEMSPLLDGTDNVCVNFETELTHEIMESEDQENPIADNEHMDTEDPSM